MNLNVARGVMIMLGFPSPFSSSDSQLSKAIIHTWILILHIITITHKVGKILWVQLGPQVGEGGHQVSEIRVVLLLGYLLLQVSMFLRNLMNLCSLRGCDLLGWWCLVNLSDIFLVFWIFLSVVPRVDHSEAGSFMDCWSFLSCFFTLRVG